MIREKTPCASPSDFQYGNKKSISPTLIQIRHLYPPTQQTNRHLKNSNNHNGKITVPVGTLKKPGYTVPNGTLPLLQNPHKFRVE